MNTGSKILNAPWAEAQGSSVFSPPLRVARLFFYEYQAQRQ
jgi:hypothetical protein